MTKALTHEELEIKQNAKSMLRDIANRWAHYSAGNLGHLNVEEFPEFRLILEKRPNDIDRYATQFRFVFGRHGDLHDLERSLESFLSNIQHNDDQLELKNLPQSMAGSSQVWGKSAFIAGVKVLESFSKLFIVLTDEDDKERVPRVVHRVWNPDQLQSYDFRPSSPLCIPHRWTCRVLTDTKALARFIPIPTIHLFQR